MSKIFNIDPDEWLYQWREIGEGDWVTTYDTDWILYCESSPLHDTRVVEKQKHEQRIFK